MCHCNTSPLIQLSERFKPCHFDWKKWGASLLEPCPPDCSISQPAWGVGIKSVLHQDVNVYRHPGKPENNNKHNGLGPKWPAWFSRNTASAHFNLGFLSGCVRASVQPQGFDSPFRRPRVWPCLPVFSPEPSVEDTGPPNTPRPPRYYRRGPCNEGPRRRIFLLKTWMCCNTRPDSRSSGQTAQPNAAHVANVK